MIYLSILSVTTYQVIKLLFMPSTLFAPQRQKKVNSFKLHGKRTHDRGQRVQEREKTASLCLNYNKVTIGMCVCVSVSVNECVSVLKFESVKYHT